MAEAELKLSSAANVEINSIQLGTEIAQSLRSNQEAQRAWLAELLFPRVQKIKGDALAPKITGMLTDVSRLNISEILEFVTDDALLKNVVEKAAQMLKAEGVTYESLSITIALEYAKQLRARLAEFLQLEQSRQRQILGELLFPLVRQVSKNELAPRVTGMLIDLEVFEVPEILEFLENHSLLQEQVMEAIEILQPSQNSVIICSKEEAAAKVAVETFKRKPIKAVSQNLPNVHQHSQNKTKHENTMPVEELKRKPLNDFNTVADIKARLTEFLSLDKKMQKLALEKTLFPLVKGIAGENFAQKITGMLSDLSKLKITEVLLFLENRNLLEVRVYKAFELIETEGI